MNFEPFLLEDWLIRCLGARIDLDHSGAPNPMREGFDPCVGGEAFLDEFEVEEKLYKAISSAYKVKQDRIALTCGAQSANFTFFQCCSGRRDAVAVESPTYAPIRACADAMFAIHPTRGQEEGGRLRVDQGRVSGCPAKGRQGGRSHQLAQSRARRCWTTMPLPTSWKGRKRRAPWSWWTRYIARWPMDVHRRRRSSWEEMGSTTNGLSKLWGLARLAHRLAHRAGGVARKVTDARLYSSWHLPTRPMALAVQAIKKREWFRKRVLEVAKRNLP